jgi:hypothetical protein
MTPTPPSPKPFSPLDYLFALLAFAGGLALYLHTLATTLLLGDGGEFQVLGSTLGLAHPTGYPVYLLLVKLVTLLPLQDLAYRANLASALFGGLTLALIYLAGRLLGANRTAALAGPAALALTPLFWWHAVMAEVYTPATAFISLVLLLALLWRRTGNSGYLFWAGLAGGLGLGVHGMLPLIAPAAGVYLVLGSIRHPDWRAIWLKALGGAALGAVLWVGAFWALDRLHPPSNILDVSIYHNLELWEIEPEDFTASFWVRFQYLASGRMFHELMLQNANAVVRQQWQDYASALQNMFPPLCLWLAALGTIVLVVYPDPASTAHKSHPTLWREALLLLLAWLGLLSFVLTYKIFDIWSFYIPTFPPLAILASAGAGSLAGLGGRLLGRAPSFRGRAAAALAGLLGLALAGSLVLPSLPVIRESWAAGRITFLEDGYNDYPYPIEDPDWPHNYSSQVARAIVDEDAMVFTTWDLLYPILYVLHLEQGRTGVQVHESYRSLTDSNPSDMTLDYIRANLGKRPIYVTRIYENMRPSFNFFKVPGIELYLVTGTK